ncbi:MAG: hypothetical protein K2N09_00240 [Muribaculaceae bacterium]|nr:hypothetical protein [Muribaculaceae bacterium]
MKKLFTFSIALALAAHLMADSVRVFKCSEDGIPGQTEPQFMGLSMSADGHYICGTVQQGGGIFIADSFTGSVKFNLDGEYSSELRSVDNFGKAIGFIDDDGVLYSFDTEEISSLNVPDGYRYVLGEGLSDDGSVMVGELTVQSFDTMAAFSAGDGAWTPLPNPSDAELGDLKDKFSNSSAAKFVSSDGKVILGHMGSFTYPIVWTRNDAGEYIPDFFPARFVKAVEADRYDDSKPLYGITAMFTCMSHNGKYVGTVGLIANETNTDTRLVPVIYNTEDKTLKIYSESQTIDAMDMGLYPRAIADDGTFIGTVASPSSPDGNLGAFIMKAGDEQAQLFVEVFPAFNEQLGESDLIGQNLPTGISADGNYILGYTYYSADYDIDSDDPAYYITYVLSVDDSGVDQIASGNSVAPVAVFSIDGRSLTHMQKGLNIVRNSDGSVSKILKR